MANQSTSAWIWRVWAAVFLVSGVILGGTSLVRPGLVRNRNSLSDDVEIKRGILSLRDILDNFDRLQRTEGSSDITESSPEALAQMSPRQQFLTEPSMSDDEESDLEPNLIAELEAEISRLGADIVRLEQDNRQLTQENDELRGYQVDYQQRIRRRIESLQPHVDQIRQLDSVEDGFSLDGVNLSYLRQTINFQELEAELARKTREMTTLQEDIRFLEHSFSFALILGMANLVVGLVYYWLERWNQEQSQKMKETEQKIEEAQLKIRNFSWNMANASLEKYYQRNLMEVQVIFMTSVAVMILGFLLILASLALTLYSSEMVATMPESSSESQLAERESDDESSESRSEVSAVNPNTSDVATIGVIAGILTNFIGATFMIVYRSTVREASRYSNSLNRINDVGIAMDILNTSVEHQDNPEILAAKVEIAKRLVESDRHPNSD